MIHMDILYHYITAAFIILQNAIEKFSRLIIASRTRATAASSRIGFEFESQPPQFRLPWRLIPMLPDVAGVDIRRRRLPAGIGIAWLILEPKLVRHKGVRRRCGRRCMHRWIAVDPPDVMTKEIGRAVKSN
jgi:hypothetical protein